MQHEYIDIPINDVIVRISSINEGDKDGDLTLDYEVLTRNVPYDVEQLELAINDFVNEALARFIQQVEGTNNGN